MNRKNAIAAAAGILVILAAITGAISVLYWHPNQEQTPIVPSGDVTASLAWQMITNGSFPNLTVVDVRTPDEYNIMHIQGAINIPYYNMTDFPTRLSPLAGDEDREIVMYCLSGIRSENAWLYLNSTGNYHRIYNVLGGINAWRAMNYTVWHAPSGTISLKEAWWMVVMGQGVNGTFPNLVILDVRDATAYADGHLPNATNIPYKNDFDFFNIVNRTSVLAGKENCEIIVYCSGVGCQLSDYASSVLRNSGFNMVYVMWQGYSTWQYAGYPTQKNDS